MRKLLFAIVLIAQTLCSQVLIDDTGSSNDSPHPSTILELKSNNKGFLPPRLTLAQRQNIQNPSEGLMIYLITNTEQCLQIYKGNGNWSNIYCPSQNSAPTAQNVTITGNSTVGSTLTANYTYADNEGDTENNSIINWYSLSSSQSSDYTSLNNNTESYTIQSSDLNKYIVFSVIPNAITGAQNGTQVFSSVIGPITNTPSASASANINEFHYDNASTDANEFVEIRVEVAQNNQPNGIDDYIIAHYNGANVKLEESSDFTSLVKSCDTSYCYYIWNTSLQNGPDGLALIDNNNNVLEFISYEGSFTAIDGPANGTTSTNIGIQEGNSSTINGSLYLDNTGSWRRSLDSNTKGSANY